MNQQVKLPTVAVPSITSGHMIIPAPVISATTVAELLHYRHASSFHSNRARLEAHGFPPKLPALNGWSYAAVMRWIEKHGEAAQ